MKRLLSALLLCASPAFAQANGWQEIQNGWSEIQTPPGYSTIPAPSGCASGLVPYFNASLQLVCSPTVYAPATDTTTSTGTVVARNLTASALATPVITPPVSPVLSLLTTVTVVAGASLADGDYFTLSDGSAVVYEFDSAPAGVTAGRVAITFTGAENAQAIRDLVVVAVNGSTLAAQAIAAAADTLTVTLDVAGNAGGVNSENVTDAGFLVPVWGEPVHVTTYGYRVEACLADGSCAPSAEVQTTTGHATLSNANYNSVTWGVVTGAATYKLTRVTGTPAGGDAPPRLLYSGPLLNFSDTNATSTSEAVATLNETGRLTSSALTAGRVVIVGTGGLIQDDAGFTFNAATGVLTVAAAGIIRNSIDTYAAGYTDASADYGLHLANFASLTWAAGAGASGVVDLGLIRSAAGWGKVTNGASGYGGWIMQGLQYVTGSRPTCDAAARGMTWYVAGGAGVADTIEVCGKAAADTYSWVALATF